MQATQRARRFCDKVLTLHPSILKVFILEQRDDHFVVTEEAARAGIGWFGSGIDQCLATGSLNPALILSSSADRNLGTPSLVGVAYDKEAVMFTRINIGRILAICTEPSSFDEALKTVHHSLPNLIEKPYPIPATDVKSAGEAAEIARNYVAAAARTLDVSIDGVTLNESRRMWDVQGAYRSNPFARSRSFQLQLGSESGAIMGFVSPHRPSLAPLFTGISIILGALLFLLWIVFLTR